ncbi:MAG: hypothetical protein OEW00_06175 [candidate division Zixibacteria bacterium]|nr:hypothetical protein [candidate division Zixibacteria bacterium]
MRLPVVISVACAILVLFALSALADNSGRIYGVVTTVDGDTFEGLIRWDKNEGSWVDLLNGNKEIPKKYLSRSKSSGRKKYSDREGSIRILGMEIGRISGTGWDWSNSAQSGIRFGHIKSMEILDDDHIRLVTQSGLEVELGEGSTDIGSDIREIIIEDRNEGEIELVWDDIEMIEFMAAKTDKESSFGERLYGKLETRRGEQFVGFVCWDVDELFAADILDGDEKRRKRKISFGKIAAIERYSSSGATVIMQDGDEMLLRGSNDVNDENRGITICDNNLGQVVVDWDEFERIEFLPAPKQIKYSDFDGGKLMRGTVFTEDGEQHSGTIRWDNDEEYTWEILDGSFRDVEFDIEFGKIKEIQKSSYRSSTVTLWDGRSFRLSGSNDVDDDNKGIFVTTNDGDEVEVDWDEFDKVVFED